VYVSVVKRMTVAAQPVRGLPTARCFAGLLTACGPLRGQTLETRAFLAASPARVWETGGQRFDDERLSRGPLTEPIERTRHALRDERDRLALREIGKPS
jgi:hypothetical protein